MALIQVWRGRARPGTEVQRRAMPGRNLGAQIKVTWRPHQWRRERVQDGARFWWCRGPGGNADVSERGALQNEHIWREVI